MEEKIELGFSYFFVQWRLLRCRPVSFVRLMAERRKMREKSSCVIALMSSCERSIIS